MRPHISHSPFQSSPLNTKQIQDFRNNNLIKSFYKFIHEHDLRSKALALLIHDPKEISRKKKLTPPSTQSAAIPSSPIAKEEEVSYEELSE